MSKPVRTRYAPSPTGFFHIGGARGVVLNYLFAKHYNGEFVVRMEDTDLTRNIPGGIDSQLDGMEWLQIIPDESPRKPGKFGPYIQSQKFDRFAKMGQELIAQGKAYYCFCTEEEIENSRKNALAKGVVPKYNRHCLKLTSEEIQAKLASGTPHAIRLKMPNTGMIEWKDMVRGNMSVPADNLTDPVIVKSNGVPTYNFAVVIDDHEMQISHILRGEEHLYNTATQICIMRALGYDDKEVIYGHLSLVVNETGKKLSKRDASLKQFISDYQQMGYLPAAVVNFLALLGWSPKQNVEILSIQELIEQFDSARISKAPSFFDVKKLNWISSQYFKKMEQNEYLQFVKKFIAIDITQLGSKYDEALLIFKNQISYATELNKLITDLFFVYDKTVITTLLPQFPEFKNNINCLATVLSQFETITIDNGNEIVNKVKELSKLSGKDLFMPIRLIAVAKEHGPEMNKILSVVGKQKLLELIKAFNI